MRPFRNRTLTTALGTSAAMASAGGMALGLVASVGGTAVAGPVTGQDINNDWGQTPQEIAAEIRSQVAVDPAVVDAKARYTRALHLVESRKADVQMALRAYHKAQRTRSHGDDRLTKRALDAARHALAKAQVASTAAKSALGNARAVAEQQITALHYVLAPTPTGSTTAPSPSTSSPPPASGTFLGAQNNTNPYGTTQVQITVLNGAVTAVSTPVFATIGDSLDINQKALPKLQSEALVAQSSAIASVSGATYTSAAFKESLHSALVLAGLPD